MPLEPQQRAPLTRHMNIWENIQGWTMFALAQSRRVLAHISEERIFWTTRIPSMGSEKKKSRRRRRRRGREREGRRGGGGSNHQVSRRAPHPFNAGSDSNRRECAHCCCGGSWVLMRAPVCLDSSPNLNSVKRKIGAASCPLAQDMSRGLLFLRTRKSVFTITQTR